jgi:flagellar biosynthesis/type III secretory pathway M-ring protein FliF/YscJ
LSRRQDENWGWGCLLLLALLVIVGGGIALVNWFIKHPQALVLTGVVFYVVLLVGSFLVILIVRQRKQARLQAEEERRERVRQWQAERQEQARQREAEKRSRIEAMLHPDRVRDEIHYMSGPEFERFMADLLRQKGYEVEETPLSGDQGVDLGHV